MDTENAEEVGTSWSHLGNAFLEADSPLLESQMEKMNQEYVLTFWANRGHPCAFSRHEPPC